MLEAKEVKLFWTSLTNDDIIDEAVRKSAPLEGADKFAVMRETGTSFANSIENLRLILSHMGVGRACWVFQNSSRGATITSIQNVAVLNGWS